MNKYLSIGLFCSILALGACKKKSAPLPTAMTVIVDADTAFVTTNVVTDNRSGSTIYITGKSSDGSQSLDITLSGYTANKKTFVVDYRGVGGNINGNIGLYRNGSTSVISRAGKIIITEVGNSVIKGTFDLYYLQTNIKGSFTAPAQ
jgi:hypothetical protein